MTAPCGSAYPVTKNDFNLNLPRYVDSQTTEDVQDIGGHLQGGIPVADVDALSRYWGLSARSFGMRYLRPLVLVI